MKPTKKSLTRKLDKICSDIIRSRGICEKCGDTTYEKLQCCHIFSRTYRNTRWDFNNLVCMCAGCHFWSHKNPILFTDWLRETYLGKEKYSRLIERHYKIRQWKLHEMESLLEDYKKVLDF